MKSQLGQVHLSKELRLTNSVNVELGFDYVCCGVQR